MSNNNQPNSNHSNNSHSNNNQSNNHRRKKRKKGNIIFFIIELLILAVLVLGIFWYAHINQGLRNIGTSDSAAVSQDSNQNTDNVVVNSAATVDKVMQGYTTIALVGIDARDTNDFDYSNSDTMIIVSINNDNGEIKMLSVYRDTYLNIGDGDYEKANAAYCNGSVNQFLSMLNTNLDLSITNYVAVDFKALAVLVDDVGGISITMTKEEAVHLNDYCEETSKVTGMDYTPLPEEAGTYDLNGVQAVSYARIRYTAGNDMKRTQRQRLVIEKIVGKARQQGIGAIDEIINDVFPLCKTNLSNSMIIKMAAQMIGYYDIVNTSGFPFAFLSDSPYVNSEYLVPVTLEDNVKQLHQFLFNDDSYQPSETVAEYSYAIEENTGYTADDESKAQQNAVVPAAGSEADSVK